MSLAFLGGYLWLPALAQEAGTAAPAAHGHSFKFFEPLLDSEKYNALERAGLIGVLAIAIIGLAYALMLRSIKAYAKPMMAMASTPIKPARSRALYFSLSSKGSKNLKLWPCAAGAAVPASWASAGSQR
ncbi:MAG TPA: hypothetical protein PLF81_06470 [Candidatus Anammoximicrobium sp.]|nr:hypothetical protein [Candidatus Anammoximicrobium sp.]